MADIDLEQGQSLPGATKTKYKDMGDGTHAEVVAATSASEVDEDDWTAVIVSGDNAAITTCTKAGEGDTYHYVTAIEVVLRGASAGADINIILRDGPTATGTVKWRECIGSGSLRGAVSGISFKRPIKMSESTAATLDVEAGGAAGCVLIANMQGYTKPK